MSRIEVEIRDYYVSGAERTAGQLDIKDSDEFPMSINYLIADIKNLSIRSGSYTKTFNVPATKNNNTILHDIWNPNTYVDDISSYTAAGHKMLSRKPCIIKVDGTPVLRGEVKVKNVITKGKKKEYVLQIIGDNSDWVKQLETLYLNELTEFDTVSSNTDHTLNKATIEASWSGSYSDLKTVSSYCYFYPLINYGSWKNGSGVVVDDMRPAVYIRAILDAGFKEAGYTINSTFLDTLDFKKLVLPYHGHGFGVSDAYIDARKFRAGRTTDHTEIQTNQDLTFPQYNTHTITVPLNNDSTSPNFDTGTLYNTTTYKYSANGVYDVKFKGNFVLEHTLSYTQISNTYTVLLKQYDGSATTYKTLKVFTLGFGESKSFSFNTGYMTTSASHTFELEIRSTTPLGGSAGYYYHNYKITSASYIENEIDKTPQGGFSVVLKDTLSDKHTVLDILKGLTHLFNLYYRTDVAMKTVYIEPRDSFFDATTTANDWTGKLNKNDYEIKYIDDYKKELKFGYKKDGADGHLKARDIEHDLDVGDYFYTMNDRFMIGKQEFINPTFAATYHIMDKKIIYATGIGGWKVKTKDKAPLIARMWRNWNSDDASQNNNYEWIPRILVKSYGTQADDDGSNRAWSWEGTSQTSIPTALMSGYGDVTQDELEFTGADGLFQTYYGKWIKIIEKGVQVTAMFKLQLQDLSELNLKKPIFIDKPSDLHGYYVINKIIDYSPSKRGLTKVELVKIENLGTATLDTTRVGTTKPAKDFGEVDDSRGSLHIINPFHGGSGGKLDDDDILVGNDYSNPSLVLDNGSGNMAYAGSGSFVVGSGNISRGDNQTILGSFNTANVTDLFQIGTGTSDTDRVTALKIDEDGVFQEYGGTVQAIVDDVVMDVLMEDEDNERYIKVFKSE